MKNKYYTMCTVKQSDNGEKFISDLSDIIKDIQSKGLYAEQFTTIIQPPISIVLWSCHTEWSKIVTRPLKTLFFKGFLLHKK